MYISFFLSASINPWVYIWPLIYGYGYSHHDVMIYDVYMSWLALNKWAGEPAVHSTHSGRKARLLHNDYITEKSGPVMIGLITD